MDELSDGSPPGNLRYEHTHEWRPGYPPTPVENGPVIHPSFGLLPIGCISQLREGICVEAKLDDPLNVIAHALHVHIQCMPSVVGKETNQHDEHTQCKTDLAQPTDSYLQTAHHRCCCAGCDGPNDDDLVGDRELDGVVETLETIVHLHYTNTKTCANSKHGAHHGEDVHSITHPAVDLVTNKRVEAGTNGHREAFSVTHKGQKETNHHIHNPSMDAPVKQGQVDGILSTLIIAVPKCSEERKFVNK